MHPRIGVPLAVILVILSGFSFVFNEEIDDWIKNNAVQIEQEEIQLLGLQSNEAWPVLIADFNSGNSEWGNEEAENILIPKASNYFQQISSSNINLDIDVYEKVTIPEYNVEYYGSDSGINRDSSDDGTHLPMKLAEEVVEDQMNEINWTKYDLNGDGWVDRLLILHTSIGQEEGGDSNRIWSHFTTFENSIDLPNGLKIGHYTMASLATGDSGFGTMMHEMFHQMGAYDLYPSHGTNNPYPWKGVGDWDIMANGNWNGGGKWPAIPSASTLAEIGGGSYSELDMEWINDIQDNCQGPNLILQSRTSGGESLKIKLSEFESIWIEYRDNFGYDSYLPGEGILVTYQDTSVGDLEHNELNVNPNRPYLIVIEADENNGLKTGTNDGEDSDLFSDSMKFGNAGVEIRNHDGVLVQWTVNVEINSQVHVNLTSDNCNSKFSIDAPDHGASLLPLENFEIIMESLEDCELESSLTSTDGRSLLTNTTSLNANQSTVVSFYFTSSGISNSESIISGSIICDDTIYNISTKITTLGRKPLASSIEGDIGAYSSTKFEIPIDSIGEQVQRFNLEVDGPISRITNVDNFIDLDGSDILVLDIDPNGLLSPNMLVKGEIIFYDNSGNDWTIDIELTAKNDNSNGFQEFFTPGKSISIACILAALWVVLGIRDRTKKATQEESVDNNSIIEVISEQENIEKDAWGRPLDDF